jgi:hypothetical protein
VTNLRSIDWYKDQSACRCSTVNFEEVAMTESVILDTYQYIATLTDAAVYSCDVTRSSVNQESYYDQLGVGTAFTDGIIIGESQCNKIYRITIIYSILVTAHTELKYYSLCTLPFLELQLISTSW